MNSNDPWSALPWPRKREPGEHQLEALRRSWDRPTYALFMEERTRKSKVIVETAVIHRYLGNLDGALIIGWPNGVQFTWATDWGLDWPDELPYTIAAWRGGGVNKAAYAALNFDGFAVLAFNCEALLTKAAYDLIGKFLKTRRCLVAADESSWAKSPSSARTKRLLAIGRHQNAVYRRLLDGTPAAEGSLDLWAPCAFLDPKLLGHPSYFTFRNRYAQMEVGYAGGGRQFAKHAVDSDGRKLYKNLPELSEKLSRFSFRVRRREVADVPEPEYRSLFFELTAKQRAVYDRLDGEYVADLRRGVLPVSMAITRLLRLQMISRGYYPPEVTGAVCPACGGAGSEDCPRCEGLGVVPVRAELERIDDDNPALDALIAELESRPVEPIVVWTRFRQDVDDVTNALAYLGRRVGRYDGSIPVARREENYAAFRAGALDALVATTGSGVTRGHDLSVANLVFYYSNSYALRDRLQSQSRTESLDRRCPTEVIDLIGVDTRDGPIVETLRSKRAVAELIQGDPSSKFADSGVKKKSDNELLLEEAKRDALYLGTSLGRF